MEKNVYASGGRDAAAGRVSRLAASAALAGVLAVTAGCTTPAPKGGGKAESCSVNPTACEKGGSGGGGQSGAGST